MKLLLMADTHVPHRARDLPEQLWRAIAEADVVVHAGDWICVEPAAAEPGLPDRPTPPTHPQLDDRRDR